MLLWHTTKGKGARLGTHIMLFPRQATIRIHFMFRSQDASSSGLPKSLDERSLAASGENGSGHTYNVSPPPNRGAGFDSPCAELVVLQSPPKQQQSLFFVSKNQNMEHVGVELYSFFSNRALLTVTQRQQATSNALRCSLVNMTYEEARVSLSLVEKTLQLCREEHKVKMSMSSYF